MSSSIPSIRLATEADIPALARTLATAFDDDPLDDWFLRTDEERDAVHVDMFAKLELPYFVAQGLVYMTADGSGTALWAKPPGKQTREDWSTIAEYSRHLGGPERAGRYELMCRISHAQHPDRMPHFYLAYIGVLPKYRGRGIGSALIRKVTEVCDREGIPACLESSKEANIPLYEHHGFRVLERVSLGTEGPYFWPMWRDPQGGS